MYTKIKHLYCVLASASFSYCLVRYFEFDTRVTQLCLQILDND